MLTLKAGSEGAQEALGAALAAAATSSCVIYLKGNLGAGKTTLARGFLRGLGYTGAVKSPTYTLLEPYESSGRCCYHLDLYRLADPGELEYLGIRDLLQSDAILLVEWPEKGKGELPAADLIIHIHYDPDGRRLELEPVSAQGAQLVSRLEQSKDQLAGRYS